MASNTVYKTVHQYNKESVSGEDMARLQEIADDYRKVKEYVYGRYGGIGSLAKLTPGYTIQNEMTESGLRGRLGLPSVYFYLAVFDALADIRKQWSKTKSKVSKLVSRNEKLVQEEKHYLRFLLKTGNAFTAVLNQEPVELPRMIQRSYEELADQIETEKLHRYLCRQVRKYHVKQHAGETAGFSIAERAYRYGDHGIYISTKENRKRVFIPLTDSNQYSSQLYVRLIPEENGVEIKVPVKITICAHADYTNEVGVAIGMSVMLTTDQGHRYGEELGTLQGNYTEWMREQTIRYHCNKDANPGRKKYTAKKNRLTEQMHSYINQELNRFLKEEKPKVIYMIKLPRAKAAAGNRWMNYHMTLWQRGYIRERLIQKCRENAISLVWVLGKDISNACSHCGEMGIKKEGIFFCKKCGYTTEEKINTAKNVSKRGREGKTVN